MRIAAIHLEPGGVGWHRCWNWTTAMKRRGHEVKHAPHESVQFEWKDIDAYLSDVDVVITGRMHHAQVFAALLAGRKIYKYKLIVDTDDDADTLAQWNQAFADYHGGAGTTRLVRAEYREADLVTVATQRLREATEKYNGNIVVVPNVVDPALYRSVRSREKEIRHRNDIRIYWGGGAAHYDDLLMVREPLLRLFHENPRVKLVFSNFVPDWAADLPAMRVFMIPFAHFNAYPKVLKWLCADIAIAPLRDTPFNASKSNVKYLDYAMAGIPGVYSDLEPYRSVKDGFTGLKCRTEKDWYQNLRHFIDIPDFARRIAANAKEHVLEEFTIDRWASRYESMLNELLAKKPMAMPAMLTEGVPCQI